MSKYSYDPRFYPFGDIDSSKLMDLFGDTFFKDIVHPNKKSNKQPVATLLTEYLHNNKLHMLYKLNNDVTCNKATITDDGYIIGIKLDFVDSNGKGFYDGFKLPRGSYDANSVKREMLNDHLMLISIEVKSKKMTDTEKEF